MLHEIYSGSMFLHQDSLWQKAGARDVPVGPNLKMHISYPRRDYFVSEGIATVRFHLVENGKTSGRLTSWNNSVYSLRGFPTEYDGKTAFIITTVKPEILFGTEGSSYALTPEECKDFNPDVYGRQAKLIADFMEQINLSPSTGEGLNPHDAFLVLGVEYLKSLGIETCLGVSHFARPEVQLGNETLFNYDTLFSTNGFTNSGLRTHAWRMDTNRGFPTFQGNHLPRGMCELLPKVAGQ